MSDYRESHNSSGYGEIYRRTYAVGYYAAQWEHIERPLLREVFQELRGTGCRSYLDFACGTGRILEVGQPFFDYLVGVDISEDMARHARAVCSSATIHAPLDITKTPLKENFDVISAFRFFLNAQPSLRREVLGAMSRMQVKGGYLVCNIHVNSLSILGRFYRLRNWMKGRKIAATLGVEEFTGLLDKAGYDVSRTYAYSFWPRIGNRMPSVQNRILLAVERWQNMTGILPAGTAQSVMFVCRKR